MVAPWPLPHSSAACTVALSTRPTVVKGFYLFNPAVQKEMFMTPQTHITLVSAALLAGLGATGHALAVQQGDILVRFGVATVAPNDDSSTVEPTFGAGSGVQVDKDTTLGLTFVYMATDTIGVELVGALPFRHDIKGSGTLSAAGKLAETKQLPPTLLAQYYFNAGSNIRPYVGAGLNYTNFFSEKTAGALSGSSIKLSDSWGLAGEVGVDIDINNDWYVNLAAWYMDIDTEATIGVGAVPVENKIDVQIDPWVSFIGIGTRF